MELLNLLYGTVLLRPYVFIFLGVYIVVAMLNMGIIRTLLFTVLAHSIAFLSEYSSTRNGFPYGLYHYIDTTRNQELWISNVPLMDSLSYSFLSYISYSMGLLLWSPLKGKDWDVQIVEREAIKNSLRVIFSAALLFMLLDVIIDPVAFRGDRWFLGKIYTYEEEGEYFNVPLTNFAGWFVVGATILFSFRKADSFLTRKGLKDFGKRDIPGKALLGPGIYFGVITFNLAVTFFIGETLLGLCGTLITLTLLALIIYKIRVPEKFVMLPQENT
ncbi:MAG: carotenoid biosynthesis protein [Nitrospinota bacterium]|nr:carotenoid biosynthesis protein [Nitrospinota bacterium]